DFRFAAISASFQVSHSDCAVMTGLRSALLALRLDFVKPFYRANGSTIATSAQATEAAGASSRKENTSNGAESLGEKTGIGVRLRIRTAILSAMQQGTNLSATLPPAAREYATIQNAAFKDAGSGRLMVVLDGEVRITKEQVQMLS